MSYSANKDADKTKKLVCKPCARQTSLPIIAQGTWLAVCVGCGRKNTQAFEIVNTKKATKEAK